MKRKWKKIYRDCARGAAQSDRGSVLPMVLGIGAMMMLAGAILIIQSQQGQNLAQGRTSTGSSLAIAEGGVARTLVLITKPNNSVLLTQNYDSINPKTGTTYLGADGAINSGDEETAEVNTWTNSSLLSCGAVAGTGSVDLPYQGTIGSNGQYKLLAYRYNLRQKTATLLVEGKDGTASAAHIAVRVAINSEYTNFPGVLSISMTLAGRNVLGKNGNVYFDASNSVLTGYAPPGSPSRSEYVNAISSSQADNVAGIIATCNGHNVSLSDTTPPGATDLGEIKASRTITNTSGAVESYQIGKLDLKANDILTVDTTAGPVYLYITNSIKLIQNAQIRNVRSDGKPPQVGDLRLITDYNISSININGTACIDTAFMLRRGGYTYFSTTGDGCPSDGNTNFDGVLWSARLSFTNHPSNSGIKVSEDLSSLSDIASGVNFRIPTDNQLSAVKSWQRVKL